MINLDVEKNLRNIKSSTLVVDIETSAFFSDGSEISIRSNFDEYVQKAKVKFFGAYSYKNNKQYYLNASTQAFEIAQLLREHNVIVGFNSEEFDFPILVNNGLTVMKKRYLQVDCMQILGKSTLRNSKEFAYKNRGALMDYKFKSNSLKNIAETMKLDFQKGDIDYAIFQKDTWTNEEILEIKKYLANDVMATKQMFDKLWNYWIPFAELLDEKFIYDLSWIRSSIASLTYKSACNVIGEEPSYSEKKSASEKMGGRVIEPKYEESEKIWYVDFASLYPHIFTMFNLPAEVDEKNIENYDKVWHGNKVFEVRGHYDISSWHPLSKYIAEKLEQRIALKETDAKNPMIYTLKILLNGLYGVMRSAIFEKVHTPNCGYDCCWLGQQIHRLTEDMLVSFGFETIAGDTDSLFLKATKKEYNNREYVIECLNQIVSIIKDSVPFPVDTFSIEIENYLHYVMWPFSEQPVIDEEIRQLFKEKISNGYIEKEIDKKKCIVETATNKIVKKGRSWVKERKGRKKNYLYIYEKENELKVKIVGLPIKKENATPLGIKIFNEVLEKEIIKKKQAKFSQEYIDSIIDSYLKDKEILKLLAVEYKVKAFDTYKKESQIQAQISKGYFEGREGIISLIKNKSVGKAGLGTKYCTIEEAVANKLTIKELDLTKLYNEINPFIENYEEKIKPIIESKKKFAKEKSSKSLKTKKISTKQQSKKKVEKLDK